MARTWGARVTAGRLCGLLAVAGFAGALVLPFLTGRRAVVIVPVARALSLPALVGFLARADRWVAAGAVALLGLAVPVALLLSLAPWLARAARPPAGPMARLVRAWRWRGWVALALGALLAAGVRASNGQGGVSLRLGPGAWAYLGALGAGALAATLLSSVPPRRGPGPPSRRQEGEP